MKKYIPIFIECTGHILFWSFYLVYPILIFGKSDCFSFSIGKAVAAISVLAFPSYTMYFFLLRKIRNAGWWTLLVILTAGLMYFFCTYDCVCHLKPCFINKLIELMFVNAVLVTVFVVKKNIIHIRLLAKSDQARADAELKALKAQINPHFLFNTLNMLYSDAIAVNEEIADKILKLSDNLHYLIHEGQKKEILMTTEIQFIENYLGLQESRMGDRVNIRFRFSIDDPLQFIPPLLLIPFVENAFKYSSMLEEKEAPVHINISSLEGIITMEVSNKFSAEYRETQKKQWKDSGIGIDNVLQRLEILFPSKHSISIIEDKDLFLVNLMIDTK